MVDVDKLSDAELRTKLLEFGFPVMPITGTTRKVMVKKLKLLMENRKKTGGQDRKSLGRYSSEEESDNDVKSSGTRGKSRRATMAAPPMQPPTPVKATRRSAGRRNDSDNDSEASATTTEVKTVVTTTRSSKVVKAAQDEFDTGSESESEINKSNYSLTSRGNSDFKKGSPVKTYSSPSSNKYSSPMSFDSGLNRGASYSSASSPNRFSSTLNNDASDRLNQIRSRLSLGSSAYDRSTYSSPIQERKLATETADTPFLSNFTKRLSQLSSSAGSPKGDYDYKNDIIKEHDSNGSSSYARSYLNRPLRHREYLRRDFQSQQESNILKNNMVSFAVLAVAFLFFVVITFMYLGIRSDGGGALDTSGYVIPYCVKSDLNSKKGVNCVLDSDVIGAVNILKVIKPELIKRAVNYKCSDSAIKPYMTEPDMVRFISDNYAIQDQQEILKDITNFEVLLFKNPAWGISAFKVDQSDASVSVENEIENMEQIIFNRDSKTVALAVPNPELPWKCTLFNKLSLVLNVGLFAGAIFVLLYGSNYAFKYYKYHQQKQKDEVFFMVERIIDTLQQNAAEDGENNNFLVINHVRDMILPVNNRKIMEKTWKMAIKFINENESRVRTEVQVVQGEPYEVWRWLGSPGLNSPGSPRTKTWQGQAFETQVGSVNSLPCSPTPCLKIRGMIEEGDRNFHTIREAVLSKCAHQCRILHCAVDANSNCVYLKCADQNDAAVAYRNLHGWWYAGHLVTVKYLRLERYMQRFPDSPLNGPPFLKAVSPPTDWTS